MTPTFGYMANAVFWIIYLAVLGWLVRKIADVVTDLRRKP